MNTLTIRFGQVAFFDEPSAKKVVVTVSDDKADGFFTFDSIAETLKEVPDIGTLTLKIVDSLPQFEHLEFRMLPGGEPELVGGQIKVKGYQEMIGSKGAIAFPTKPAS